MNNMNVMFPEILSDLNQKRIKDEMDSIRLEMEASQGQNLLDKNLAALGEWMVNSGERLRKRSVTSLSVSTGLAHKVA